MSSVQLRGNKVFSYFVETTKNDWLGIVFVYENELTNVGCYSLVGQYGYDWCDGSVFNSIAETGAPQSWQMIALADSCAGDSIGTVQHEFLHALGFSHEFQENGQFFFRCAFFEIKIYL